MFNYKQVYCISLEDNRLKEVGHDNGITVMANVDNISFKTIDLKTRNAVKSLVKHNNQEFMLFSLYLDDLEEDTRLKQVKSIKKELAKDSPQLIMGDLNTFSPKDAEDTRKAIEEILEQKPEFKKLRKQIGDMARGEVIQYLMDLGFKDASAKYDNTFPTSLSPLGNKPLGRLDYCLYKNLNIKDFEVFRGELCERTSDHYPILVEI